MWIHLVSLGLIDGAGGGVIPPEPVVIGGHYGDFWRKKYLAQFQYKKPTLEQVIEYVEDEPQEALEVVREVAPVEARGIDISTLRNNAQAAEFLAKQILVAIQLRQVQARIDADEDDIESLMLLM